jgi:hypothetical protein
MDRESVGKLLRSLEAKNLVGRVAYKPGAFLLPFRGRFRTHAAADEGGGLTHCSKHLDLWAPATAEEAAFALHLPVPEVATALKCRLTEDGLLEEGRFIVGEREQLHAQKGPSPPHARRGGLRPSYGRWLSESKLERKFGR